MGSGQGVSLKALVDLLLLLRDSDLKPIYQPYASDDARHLVKNRIGCPKMAAAELGFRVSTLLAEGLSDLILWRNSNKAV